MKSQSIELNFISEATFKIILSKPSKQCRDCESPEPNDVYSRIEILQNSGKFQASMFTSTKVFHKNLGYGQLQPFINGHIGKTFLQLNSWDGVYEHQLRITKKGKAITSRVKSSSKPTAFKGDTMNREKNTIIKEGVHIPVLVDMGVFTKELKIAAAMQDKFRQINRFIELIDDVTKNVSGSVINIIDFGCGKSYLTFLLHYYFTEVKGTRTNICGLDSNSEVVKTCKEAVEKYGLTSIEFIQGDIGGLKSPPLNEWGEENSYNIVISLHACDTATDYAIHNAVMWQADLICVVPCCQHELRAQMKSNRLKIFDEYGIIKERVASLATDAIRAKLLEHSGYKVQIIEFTPMENTPKNLFIRAVKTSNQPKKSQMEQVEAITKEFGFEPTLLKLHNRRHT